MERIGRDVERALARTGGGAALALTEITARWPEVVGDAVARQAWPLRLARDGTLHVAATSATWAFELDRLAPEILARLGAAIGDSAPSKLAFKVGPVPEPGSAADAPVEATPGVSVVDPETAREAQSAASAIEDPELRELVARAARASLQRARSGRRF